MHLEESQTWWAFFGCPWFPPHPTLGHTYLVLHYMSLANHPDSQNIHEKLILYWRLFPREKVRKALHCSPHKRNINKLPDLLSTPSPHCTTLFSLPTASSFFIVYLTVTVASPKPSETPWNLILAFSLYTPLIQAGTKLNPTVPKACAGGWARRIFSYPFSMPSCSWKSFVIYG